MSSDSKRSLDVRSAMLIAMTSLTLSGCSVGGNESEVGSESGEGSSLYAALGPIGGATVTVHDLEGNHIGSGRTVTYLADRDTRTSGSRRQLLNVEDGRRVGQLQFTRLAVKDLDEANLVIVRTSGGTDIDPNDDGIISANEGNSATSISGGVGAIVRVGDLDSSPIVLNSITSLGVGAAENSQDSFEIIDRLNRLATFLLKGRSDGGDLNQDGQVDYRDLYAFDPTRHDFSASTPTQPDLASIRSEALATRLVMPGSPPLNVPALLSAGGSDDWMAQIALTLFGDQDADGLANVFGDPDIQDTDGDGIKDADDDDLDGDGLSNEIETEAGYIPWNRDVNRNGTDDGDDDDDNDGLTNRAELDPPSGTPPSDPNNPDTDGDGLNDKVEVDNDLDPTDSSDGALADTDGDGIPNQVEIENGLDPTSAADGAADADEDGLNNSDEFTVHSTDFQDEDSDDDGINDGDEVANGFDPLDPADGNAADEDSDGISNVKEIEAGLDPRDPDDAALDPDEDGLTNLEELTIHNTNPNEADTDEDGLSDFDEVNVTLSDPTLDDTDSDGRLDGEEVNDPTFPSDPNLADSDADGLSDLVEVGGDPEALQRLFDGTVVQTSPTQIDTDGDGLSDSLELSVQESFRRFGSIQSATALLRGALHPNNLSSPAQLGGLEYLDPDQTSDVLEQDPDGDGKPTIEELFHATNPNDSQSTFAYRTEAGHASASQHQALTNAHFEYVPGGWDVNNDGNVENGFYVSVYEARASNTFLDAAVDEASGLLGNIVYSSSSQQFSGRLCVGGSNGDASTVDTNGLCRGNQYSVDDSTGPDTAPDPPQINQVTFTPALAPYVGVTWLEARLALLSSPVPSPAGNISLDLPTEIQSLQMIRLAAGSPPNWRSGAVGSGALYRGHTDNSPSTTLPVSDSNNPYVGTGNSAANGPDQRRTLVLQNGTLGRDFDVPIDHEVVIWDLAGNAAEWTRGLFAANSATARPVPRQGGDRFANGISELWDYASGQNQSGRTAPNGISSMPNWWKPALPDGTLLGLPQGVGGYYDGTPLSDTDGLNGSNGGSLDDDYGYGLLPYSDGYVGALRGGSYSDGGTSGISATNLTHGVGRMLPAAGFRATTIVP